ncbi:glycosyltransferase family 25 protein [Streptomyces iconiensis]|uniref:Glycosyltransferase family 25 protein n=1 Tax=Streptomyces iconiensis TaxID=1384038 RepID=A0ABT7A055_9ACTN|nr:glycosyltransferase family 25 protein [Streptomyces iconiensis]MDJ1134472.1 glycosyltransferase family 25 protein [Streptomyces iconiensis]
MHVDAGQLRTYVVNLPRRRDRRTHMESEVPAALRPLYTSDMDRNFDGRELNAAALRQDGYGFFDWHLTSPEVTNAFWKRPMKYGEVGCVLAHLACWQDAVASDASFFLVLEDDVCLPPLFVDRLLAGIGTLLERHPKAGLLYLLRFPEEPEREREAGPGFVTAGFSYWTCGYVLSREAAEKFLGAGLPQALIPVDEFLPAMYMDHPREDVRRCFPRRISAFAFSPPLLARLSRRVVGSDTRESEVMES